MCFGLSRLVHTAIAGSNPFKTSNVSLSKNRILAYDLRDCPFGSLYVELQMVSAGSFGIRVEECQVHARLLISSGNRAMPSARGAPRPLPRGRSVRRTSMQASSCSPLSDACRRCSWQSWRKRLCRWRNGARWLWQASCRLFRTGISAEIGGRQIHRPRPVGVQMPAACFFQNG